MKCHLINLYNPINTCLDLPTVINSVTILMMTLQLQSKHQRATFYHLQLFFLYKINNTLTLIKNDPPRETNIGNKI